MKNLILFEDFEYEPIKSNVTDKMYQKVMNDDYAQNMIKNYMFNKLSTKNFKKIMKSFLKKDFDNIATDKEIMDVIEKFIEQ